ncbi:hypothetical protein HA402_011965 [Bradysia odoriphaga]|nr:hypothetical protein HA402_011965 [Bradysia odoriphaga]
MKDFKIHFSSFAKTNIFEDAINDFDYAPKKVFKAHTYPLHLEPHPGFNAERDGRKLREAIEGSGTDEQCIIDILTTRTNVQRQKLATLDRDLIDDLKSKMSGKFRDIIIGLMTPLNEYLCNELHKSLSGLSTDEEALVEILCTKNNKEMAQLIVDYDDLYNRPLVEHLCSGTGGYFRRLLIMIVTGSRDQGKFVDPALARKHATALDDTGKGKLICSDEEVFNRILSHDNLALLRKVFEEFKNKTGKTIEEEVIQDISGDLKEAMLAIIESVQSGPAFFAKRLFLAMDGIMNRDATVTRIVVSRSEIDLGLIKSEFERLYDRTLLSVVKNKTSGDYKHVLCRIIGGV